MAGAPLVTFDAIETLWTEACFAELATKASFTEARAAHVVTLPSIDTPAGLGAAHAVGPNRALILAPSDQEAGKKMDELVPCKMKWCIQNGFIVHK